MQSFSLLKHLSSCIRILSAEAIEKAKSGHPGMPLGMSDVITMLTFEFLKFNPNDANWLGRDKLVLSAGHGSMLLYSLFYLTGYNNFSLADIQNFRQLNSKAAGHPERELFPAIETTTGPLGQGLANAVGMAIANKKYSTVTELLDSKIYCIVGDGCLMEGVSYEAASIAGHLKLNNLIVLFDDNSITIDGPTSLTISENQIEKFKALGWNAISADGHNFESIHAALKMAQTSDKPLFIAFKTQIGYGAPNKANRETAHGSPLGASEIEALKLNLEWKNSGFEIPGELLEIWRNCWKRNQDYYNNWKEKYNNLDKRILSMLQGFKYEGAIKSHFKNELQHQIVSEPTRSSSGRVIDIILSQTNIIIGSADLSISNNLKSKVCNAITHDNFAGNFIHYGPREAAMAAIMNGLSLSGFKAIGGTFLVFSDYMRPAIRLAALMQQPVIYVLTHDSIGLGEDGPTHQPVEHLASLRAIPNLNVMRPADIVEVTECWHLALQSTTTPTVLALSRQKVKQYRNWETEDNLCEKGAYILSNTILPVQNEEDTNVTIFATGSEVEIAMEVKQLLEAEEISTKVISVPSFEKFDAQPEAYRNIILGSSKLKIGIEAASSLGWHKIIGKEGLFFGMNNFGASAPYEALMKYFGFEARYIADKIRQHLLNYAIS